MLLRNVALTRFAMALAVASALAIGATAQIAAAESPAGPAKLSQDAKAAISASLGRERPAYHAVTAGDTLRAENRDHGFSADFTSDGVRVRTGTATWGWQLLGIGYGAAPSAVRAATPQATGNRIEYRRGTLTEWYINGPFGLEQGFDVSAPPGERSGRPLTLALRLSGDLAAAVEPTGDALTLTPAGHGPRLRYRGLTAHDAGGRELRSWLELSGEELLLRVEDGDARYPIVIDPFLEQAKLTASDGAAQDSFGFEVAIDGDTIVVGVPGDDSPHPTLPSVVREHGSAYVFVKPAGGWTTTATFATKLRASDWAVPDPFFGEVGFDFFGATVAIDGDTIAIGAWGTTLDVVPQAGAVYVFVEPAGGWASMPVMTEATRLTDSIAGNLFGIDVAVLDDAVFVAAAYSESSGTPSAGAVLLFVEPAGGWATTPMMTQTGHLSASDQFDGGGGQHSVKLAADGSTLVVGAPDHTTGGNAAQGAAYVFVEPAGGWTTMTETAKLTASDGAAGDAFGSSVGVSGDHIVVGAFLDDIGANANQGSAYVFVEPVGGWATTSSHAAKLTASDGAAGDFFGANVAVSGSTVVAGAYLDDVGANSNQGTAYVFVEPPGGWTTTSTPNLSLTAADGAAQDQLYGVAIDGDTVVATAVGDDISGILNKGSAYVFQVCDDGDPCTDDTIDPGSGACQHGPAICDCDDGNPCTDDSSGPGGCVFTPNVVPCDDGNACTDLDTCSAGSCVAGQAISCDDGNACTDDACNPATGCAHANNTASCDDGNACTTVDTCDGGACVGTNPVVCTALDACHDAGVCNPSTGLCSDPPSPDGTFCSDGLSCTQVDTCQAGVCSGTDYAWSGVLQPINSDGTSIFKLGRTVPVKFQLVDGCTGLTGVTARLFLAKLTNDVLGTEIEATSTAAADTGNTFREAGNDQYIFNLSTTNLSKGTWILRIDLGDGVLNRTVAISLR